jgi:hypothetical protein
VAASVAHLDESDFLEAVGHCSSRSGAKPHQSGVVTISDDAISPFVLMLTVLNPKGQP